VEPFQFWRRGYPGIEAALTTEIAKDTKAGCTCSSRCAFR
jgi:hypothetical protein